jgi:hypothetical protein
MRRDASQIPQTTPLNNNKARASECVLCQPQQNKTTDAATKFLRTQSNVTLCVFFQKRSGTKSERATVLHIFNARRGAALARVDRCRREQADASAL